MDAGFLLLLLQAGLALALLIFIVWWTFPKKREVRHSDRRSASDDDKAQ